MSGLIFFNAHIFLKLRLLQKANKMIGATLKMRSIFEISQIAHSPGRFGFPIVGAR